MRKKAFISFDFDNDEDLRTMILGQAKHPDTPFDISDWSIRKPFADYNWEQKCLERIRKTDVVIVMVGERAYQCSGVITEINLAKLASVPYFGLHGRPDKSCPAPQGLDNVYRWTWDNVKALIDGAR